MARYKLYFPVVFYNSFFYSITRKEEMTAQIGVLYVHLKLRVCYCIHLNRHILLGIYQNENTPA